MDFRKSSAATISLVALFFSMIVVIYSVNYATALDEPTLVHIYDDIGPFHACSYYSLNSFDKLSKLDTTTLTLDSKNEVIGKISNGKWEWKLTVPYTVAVVDEKIPRTVTSCQEDNVTKEEICNEETAYDYTYKDETRYKNVWKPFDDYKMVYNHDIGVKTNPVQMVRYCADTELVQEGGLWRLAVDIIPTFDGRVYPEYNWWNTSMTRSNVTTINSDAELFLVNDTYGLDIGGGIQYIWCEKGTTQIYNDTNGNIYCSNGTDRLLTIIDEGNGTDYNLIGLDGDILRFYTLNGTDTYDHSVYGVHGINQTNIDSIEGQIGKALNFTGNSHFEVPDLYNTAPAAGTMLMWVYMTDAQSTCRNEKLIDSNNFFQINFHNYASYTQTIEFHSRSGSSTDKIRYLSGDYVHPMNQWFFLTIEWNSTGFSMYVNDSKITTWDTSTFNAGVVGGFDSDWRFGENIAGTADCLNAGFDNVLFLNRSISNAERTAYYENTKPDGYSDVGDMETYHITKTNIYQPINDTVHNKDTINLLWSFEDSEYEEPVWAAYSFNDNITNESLFFNDENYTKFFFPLSSGNLDLYTPVGNPNGIATNGSYIWITDGQQNSVYVFTTEGEYVDDFQLSEFHSSILGITTNGTYIWISDPNNHSVFMYDMNGDYTGINFSVIQDDGTDPAFGMDNDGTYFWLTKYLDKGIFRYWINNRTFSDFNFSVADETDDPWGSTTNGTYIWVTDNVDGKIYKYETDGDYTGRSFSTAASNSNPRGIAASYPFLWVVDSTDYSVFKYAYAPTFSNVTLQTSQGWNNVTVCANNTDGDLACNSTTFFVDSIPPEINITFPQNNTRYNFTWVNITGTANDTNIDTVWINDTNFGINLDDYYNWNFTNMSIEEGDYSLTVYANDTAGNEVSTEVHFMIGVWNVTFHVYSGEYGEELTSIIVFCNNSIIYSLDSGDTVSFTTGDFSCIFDEENFYNKTVEFTVNNDTEIDVTLSIMGGLTVEEHVWLDYLYDCWSTGDCRDTLNNIETTVVYINQTTEQIKETVDNVWDQFEQTDEDVVEETRINMEVNESSNITINYSINVPVKQDYQFLPIRIFYWFLDETNTSCYSQGNYTVEMVEPYCQPLVAHTIGEVNTVLNFTVEMRPSLPTGNYTLVRRIDIDPDEIWINYGHEVIGTIDVTEDSTQNSIGLKVAGNGPTAEEVRSDSVTGEVIGFMFDNGTVSLIVSVMSLVVVVTYITSRKKIR
ncbi:MAG: hypothetical protein JW789_01895 [Candidatus Aenigmarchaeota archaeon]|nr:hypothetical protein [Candidatus Aenigmarchaeota archaeon]